MHLGRGTHKQRAKSCKGLTESQLSGLVAKNPAQLASAHGLDQFQCLASVRWPRELQRIWIAIENYGAWMEWPPAKEKCWSMEPWSMELPVPFGSHIQDQLRTSSTIPDPCLLPHRCTYMSSGVYLLDPRRLGLAFLARWDTLRYKFMQINVATSLFNK